MNFVKPIFSGDDWKSDKVVEEGFIFIDCFVSAFTSSIQLSLLLKKQVFGEDFWKFYQTFQERLLLLMRSDSIFWNFCCEISEVFI